MKKIIITILILSFASSVAFAADVVTPPNNQDVVTPPGDTPDRIFPKITNPLRFNNITELVNGLVKLALELGTIVAVLALVWVGFKFIIAQGNPSEIAKAKEQLKWVIIGIAILFSAQIIVEIIKGTLSDFVDPSSWLKKP